jgi:GrpB-like predicted nucleotidyltransferase (UPF0157 family)
MIVIHHYDPGWPAEFERLRASLREALGPLALRIDHVGSTSVPGLAAKDVIDVQITVRALSDEVADALADAGYGARADITQDHVPCGADPRPEEWRKLLFVEPKGARRANIHVREDGRLNQRYALLFRDYLRSHASTAQTLELVKRELASRHADDADAYYAIKDPVYDLVWEAAREWAARHHWRPE